MGVCALKLTQTNFSISAAVGFISIFGVAVQNGVLLISYFNQMRESGESVREAVKGMESSRFAERAGELSELGLQERFQRIYETNLWSDPETRSGVGSTLDSTRVVRAELPKALRRLDARVLLDIPCGDFTWMEHVDLRG